MEVGGGGAGVEAVLIEMSKFDDGAKTQDGGRGGGIEKG